MLRLATPLASILWCIHLRQKCSLVVAVHVLAGAAVGLLLATLLEGPRETFVQLNASTSFSCLFLVGSPNASAFDVIMECNSGGQFLTFQSEVSALRASARDQRSCR